jgi:electron transport complex protein RnfG
VWLETVRAVTGDTSIVWPEHRQGLPQRWHICDPQQRLRHVLQTVQSRGYAGEITLLAALTADGHLNGVRVLEHRETPGLGDAIEHEKSNWLRQLEGLTPQTALQDAARLRVDGGSIDALTGATITSRAVVTAVASKVAGFTKVQRCDV